MCPTKEKLNKEKGNSAVVFGKIYIFQNQYQNPVYLNHINKFFLKNYWIREKMRLSKREVDKSLKLYLGNTTLEELFINNLIVQKNNGMLCDRWDIKKVKWKS